MPGVNAVRKDEEDGDKRTACIFYIAALSAYKLVIVSGNVEQICTGVAEDEGAIPVGICLRTGHRYKETKKKSGLGRLGYPAAGCRCSSALRSKRSIHSRRASSLSPACPFAGFTEWSNG
jgi:hypothetical protein